MKKLAIRKNLVSNQRKILSISQRARCKNSKNFRLLQFLWRMQLYYLGGLNLSNRHCSGLPNSEDAETMQQTMLALVPLGSLICNSAYFKERNKLICVGKGYTMLYSHHGKTCPHWKIENKNLQKCSPILH
jgi:hypothetical protein